jgi:outer membrane immunogenic protein
MKLRNAILGLALTSALALAASSANAADVYVPGPGGLKDGPVWAPEWAGFYAGVNGGYFWSSADLEPNGFQSSFLGAQAGYNFQRGNIVFGAEADFQGAWTTGNISGSHFLQVNDFGTVAGRLGYSFGRTLVFAKGGWAWGDIANTPPSISPLIKFNGDARASGWELGGGIEWKVGPTVSLKAEYQHIDFGDHAVTPTAKADVAFDTILIGANYHFGGLGYEPLK